MPRKLQKFIILFDNPNLLYFPGNFISGRVIVELEDETPVLGVYFHVIGEGVVNVVDKTKQTVQDKENYIDFRMRLLGEAEDHASTTSTTAPLIPLNDEKAQDGEGPIRLSPGIHSFPFKLGLPLGLPSTFLGKHGWVQYFCKAALREPNGLTHKNQQVFIVMNPIDLNLEPSILAQPFHCEIEHNLGLTCLTQGPVSCKVRLDRGGYVPGETISIWARIQNESKVSIKKTKASLTETIQYVSRSKLMQTETRELSTVSRGRIKAGNTDDWKYEQLMIPPLPPTNLRGCHVIRIQYDVFFIIDPASLEKEIKLQLPIMMATYPYRASDGTLKKKQGAEYPSSLPISRPWLNSKTFE